MPRAARTPEPTPPDPPAPPSALDAQEDAQHRRVLALLVDLGAALAEETARSSTDQTNTVAIRAEAFERTSRATRRTILVARHVAQQIAREIAERPAPAKPLSPTERRTTARARLLREVQDAIQTKARPADADALRAELIDRIDAPEFDADLLARPVADLIAEFLRDLGLAHPPGARPIGRRTPADIARLNLLAALPPGQAAALAATFPRPEPPPMPAPPPPPQPKKSWRDKPPPDYTPGTEIRPDSLLANLLKTAER